MVVRLERAPFGGRRSRPKHDKNISYSRPGHTARVLHFYSHLFRQRERGHIFLATVGSRRLRTLPYTALTSREWTLEQLLTNAKALVASVHKTSFPTISL